MKATTGMVALAALFFLLGCATPYQSKSFRGGNSETALAPDLVRGDFRGNGYTSPERAQDFALLRASERTIQHGFTCFAIVDERSSTTTHSFTIPGSAHTTVSGTGYSSGNIYLNRYGGTYSGTSTTKLRATTTYTPPETHVFYKPQTGLLIRTFRDKPEGVDTFDAIFLQHSLKQKYEIK